MIPLKLTHADALRIRAVRTEGESVTATLKPVPNDEAEERAAMATDADEPAPEAAATEPAPERAAAALPVPESKVAERAATSPRDYELTLRPTGEAGRSRVVLEVDLPEGRTRTQSLIARVLPPPTGARVREASPAGQESTRTADTGDPGS